MHAGGGAPVAAFAKVLRQKLASEARPYAWSSVQIDPANYSTRFVPDIVTQIAKSAGLTLPPPAAKKAAGVTIGSDVRAGGNVDFTNISVSLPWDEDFQSVSESDRVDALCSALRAALRTRRVAVIFVDTHLAEPRDLVRLSNRLWDGGLAELVEHGLLVLDIFDPVVQANKCQVWPPEPCLVLNLPERFDHDSRMHAMEDLVRIAADEQLFPSEEEARAFARTLLSSFGVVRDLHAYLATVITGLRAWQQ